MAENEATTVLNSPKRLAISLIGCAGAAGSIALLIKGMFALMAVGGACASGNTAYQIQTHCPNGAALLPVAILGWLILGGAFVWASGLPEVASLWFASLMLSIATVFGIGTFPRHGHAFQWGGLFGVLMFGVMGGAPLLVAIAGIASRLSGGTRSDIPDAPVQATPAHPDDSVTELERLAALHRQGDLSEAEYEAAKRKVLEEHS